MPSTITAQERCQQIGWLALALAVALLPEVSVAQAYTLHVTLRDAGGIAIAGVSIVVRTEDGEELARQTTGSDGISSFSGLAGVMRVAVDGQPRGGPRLYQLGDDARGVRVDLGQAALSFTLNLRAEPDGMVLPDPTTMLTLEEDGPLLVNASPIPTARIAPPAPLPTARRTAIALSEGGAATSAATPQASWVPPVTLLIIVALVAILRLVQQLRGAR